MGNDFLNELGETLSKTAQGLGERVGTIYESQKTKNRITSERRIIEKALADIGRVIYEQYLRGEVLPENLHMLCEEISEHRDIIEALKEDAASKKGKKICPNCKNAVDLSAAYCSFCGAKVPDPEPQKAEDAEFRDVVKEAEENVKDEAEDFEESVDAAAEAAADKAAEEAEEIKANVEEAVEHAADAVEEASDNE